MLVRLPLEWCSSLEILPGFMANIRVACCLVLNLSDAPVPAVVV